MSPVSVGIDGCGWREGESEGFFGGPPSLTFSCFASSGRRFKRHLNLPICCTRHACSRTDCDQQGLNIAVLFLRSSGHIVTLATASENMSKIQSS